MARATPWQDELTLLCEQCGYVIEGIDPADPCPECGTPVARSLPARRTGTPWQWRETPGRFVRTCVQTLLSPHRTFDAVRIEVESSRRLDRASFAVAAVLGAFSGVVPLDQLSSLLHIPMRGATGLVVKVLLSAMLWYSMLHGLTAIERVGVRFFGRQRSWRISPAVAETVCAHASVGWIVGAVLASAAALAGPGIEERLGNISPATNLILWLIWGARVLPLAGLLAGMLVFETLVHVGIRRCRFANRAGERTEAAN